MFWKAKADTPAIVSHPDLPYDFELLEYFPNSKLQNAPATGNPSDIGLGKEALAISTPVVNGLDQSQKVDLPSAYVRVLDKGDGHAIGTYLFSSQIDDPQSVPDTKIALAFRMKRHYKPFELKLNQFHFDRYPGTETAKNYSSELRLVDTEKNVDREVVVKMNNPLRHRGEAFFQSSFTPDEKATILQVVQNPGWMLPYISCILVMAGMTLHFSIKLVIFLSRVGRGTFAKRHIPVPTGRYIEEATGQVTPVAKHHLPVPTGPLDLTGQSQPAWLKFGIPIASALFAIAVLGGLTWPQKPKSDKLDLSAAARLPVLEGGRIKPLDSLARVELRVISHQEETRGPSDVKIPAIRWYFDTATSDPKNRDERGASELNIFRIDNDEVRDLLKLKAREGLKYSLRDIREQFEAFDVEAKKAGETPDADRDLYQKKLLELRRHVEMYLGVVYGGSARTVAPQTPGTEWQLVREAEVALNEQARPQFMQALEEAGIPLNPDQMTEDQQKQAVGIIQSVQREVASSNPALKGWKNVLAAYRTNDPKEFDKAVAEYRELLSERVDAKDLKRCEFETALNQSNLSYWCLVMYAVAGAVSLFGFVGLAVFPNLGVGIRRGVFWWLLITFLAHTFALIARMYLMDRWGVFTTNLYSSAVFIGWVVVLLCLIVETIFPIGFGNLVASALGFMTAIIAHNLAVGGDTLEMMQAVLDDNFWLSTHVTTVTAGYSATYVAGLLGIIYAALYMIPEKFVLRKPVTIGAGVHSIQSDIGKILGSVLYAVLAFATLLSFVGTVLGGIWADQSWGRFWGWDPKENGAVLIVIWNALILHARWGGMVKERGMAVLAIFGGVITTWSWFGTNQLGVGLHAYGFSKTLVDTCKILWLICGFALLAGVLPWQWIYKPPGVPLPGGKRV